MGLLGESSALENLLSYPRIPPTLSPLILPPPVLWPRRLSERPTHFGDSRCSHERQTIKIKTIQLRIGVGCLPHLLVTGFKMIPYRYSLHIWGVIAKMAR